MLVTAQHPCPVRWRPARGRERISYLALRTPVEIPEVEAGAITRNRLSYETQKISSNFFVQGGRCWERVYLKRYRMSGDAAATLQDLVDNLAHRDALPHGISVPGSPLCGAMTSENECHLQGEDLPDAILSRATSDHADAVRAAFRDWAESNLVIEAGVPFVSRPMPAYVPNARGGHTFAHRSPLTWDQGPAFEHGRIRHYRTFMGACRLFEAEDRPSVRFARQMEHLPDTRDDLRLFANAAPREAFAARDRAMARLRGDGRVLDCPDAVFAPLRTFADLGLVRAVPEDRFGEVADRVSAALSALDAALPADYTPTALRHLRAYTDFVARPSLLPPPIPQDDADSLSGLSLR